MAKNGNNSTKRNLWNRPMTRSTAGVQQSEKELSITRDTSIEKAVLTRKIHISSSISSRHHEEGPATADATLLCPTSFRRPDMPLSVPQGTVKTPYWQHSCIPFKQGSGFLVYERPSTCLIQALHNMESLPICAKPAVQDLPCPARGLLGPQSKKGHSRFVRSQARNSWSL